MFKKFLALSRLAKVALGVGVITVLGIASSASQPQTKNLTDQKTSNTTQQHAPAITTKTVDETQAIPFESTTANDATLAKGTSKVTTAGVNGVSTLTYKVTYSDGAQTKKELVSQVITTPPVTQVTSVGTYVAPLQPTCPNGTYVNTYGNTVCSPYASSSAPAGATAQCVDGTYSFSQSHSGTCSHHGGVSTWL